MEDVPRDLIDPKSLNDDALLDFPPDDTLDEFLERVIGGLQVAADISRADILLYRRRIGKVSVLAHVAPRSISSLYYASELGRSYSIKDQPLVASVLDGGKRLRSQRNFSIGGTPVDEDAWPVFGPSGRLVAVMSIVTNLIEVERQRQRSPVFQAAVNWLKFMAVRGDIRGGEDLSPFGEFDGVVYVDQRRIIRYLSGIATNLYRRVGHLEDLRGKHLLDLHTRDDDLVSRAFQVHRCLEETAEVGTHFWVRKVIPLRRAQRRLLQVSSWFDTRSLPLTPAGAFLLIHDATEARQQEQELKIKSALIKEVHHRVKNNLAAVSSLVRMQARRITSVQEAQLALADTEKRIHSVGVIHEFLSRDEGRPINIKEVCQRIVEQVKLISEAPGQTITIGLSGPNLYLTSHQATACSLAVNELVSNAIEHSSERELRDVNISITLEDQGDFAQLIIADDGPGLPDAFDLNTTPSLGLQIVRTLAQEDLKGTLELHSSGHGTSAILNFPKAPLTDA